MINGHLKFAMVITDMLHTTYNPGKYVSSSNGRMPANFQEPLTDQDVV